MKRRDLLRWSLGGLLSGGTFLARPVSAAEGTAGCLPDSQLPEADIDGARFLDCLEAELRAQGVPIAFEILPGASAQQDLEDRQSQDGTHFIVGGLIDLENLLQRRAYNEASIQEILKKAEGIDGAAWLTLETHLAEFCEMQPILDSLRRADMNMALLCSADRPFWDSLAAGHFEEVMNDDWPDEVQQQDSLDALWDYDLDAPRPEVVMASLELDDWTQTAALLKFGGWNACPNPEVHVAVWRHWRELYGIELASAQADLLEFHVARPPQDREGAVRLALEQYRYCSDIVDQGVGSVTNLAAMLLDGPYWYFWWE